MFNIIYVVYYSNHFLQAVIMFTRLIIISCPNLVHRGQYMYFLRLYLILLTEIYGLPLEYENTNTILYVE